MNEGVFSIKECLTSIMENHGISSQEYTALEKAIEALEVVRQLHIAGLSPEEVMALATAQRENRLVVLQCKIGDSVYVPNIRRGFISEMIITAAKKYDTGGTNYFWKAATENTIYPNMVGFFEHEIGITVFLDREAAEAALKEQTV